MFFIFGIGPKTKVIEKNQFLCPVCRTRSAYELKQQRNYFSLFFIPLDWPFVWWHQSSKSD